LRRNLSARHILLTPLHRANGSRNDYRYANTRYRKKE